MSVYPPTRFSLFQRNNITAKENVVTEQTTGVNKFYDVPSILFISFPQSLLQMVTYQVRIGRLTWKYAIS